MITLVGACVVVCFFSGFKRYCRNISIGIVIGANGMITKITKNIFIIVLAISFIIGLFYIPARQQQRRAGIYYLRPPCSSAIIFVMFSFNISFASSDI